MVTITLPPDLEEAVTRRAHDQGTTPEVLAVDELRRIYLAAQDTGNPEGKTLLDYWTDYIGSVDSRDNGRESSNLSENTGQKFAQLMVDKHRHGKL
jgi:hypothetical protein